MRKIILIATVLLMMTSLFAITPPNDAPAYMEYPETGFIAWSYTEKELPLSISTADMCIVSECVGYFPCTLMEFEKGRTDFKVYRIMNDGTEMYRYFIYENNTYITDHDLIGGEVFVLRTDDNKHEIFITKTYVEKLYPETGFRAYSFSSDKLPESIYVTWTCIQSDCAGDVPCTVFDFGPDCPVTNMKVYRIKADGTEAYRYFKYADGVYIADTILEEGESFVLRTIGNTHEVYVTLI